MKNTRTSSTTIFISIIGLLISILSVIFSYHAYKSTKYDATPSFNVVQNLWDRDNPSFTLLNESTKKLAQSPNHTYLLMIPSKIITYSNDSGKTKPAFSWMVFSFISDDVIEKQTDTYKTVGPIETSYLPSNFYGRKVSKDFVYSKKISVNKSMYTIIQTYPMLAIVCDVKYRYGGEKKMHNDQFISTPIDKVALENNDVKFLTRYLVDNSNQSIIPKKDNNIYKTANNKIYDTYLSLINNADEKEFNEFIGASKQYHGITKKLNNYLTVTDPAYNFLNE